ncbi:MAG TPA: hypothetical protein DCE42_19215 [Myxococcales bacterium]|nr:hypothetical protein [Deltaproteobacteria bacterium]MBU51604.1 hypothetical protein [Deltaproteobacteria bacterium]HAA56905.1 hypothetical protein [Myxococcales bacterium]
MKTLQLLENGHQFEALLFDMDGTLVDSEPQTGQAIEQLLGQYNIPDASLPTRLTSGQSWASIVLSLEEKYPPSKGIDDLEEKLIAKWDELVRDAPVAIPGAPQAVEEASKLFSVGVVSSSPRYLIDLLLQGIGVQDWVPEGARVGGDQVTQPKPEPEGFLKCAEILGVAPGKCLVFEDSIAGLTAAKAAGMKSVLITETCMDMDICLPFADDAVQNYTQLPTHFWRQLSSR